MMLDYSFGLASNLFALSTTWDFRKGAQALRDTSRQRVLSVCSNAKYAPAVCRRGNCRNRPRLNRAAKCNLADPQRSSSELSGNNPNLGRVSAQDHHRSGGVKGHATKLVSKWRKGADAVGCHASSPPGVTVSAPGRHVGSKRTP